MLSVFPGADLFGRAFERCGFCVVRGPEKLLGQDIRNWRSLAGRFDGVIGGPPCQAFSNAAISGTNAENLIPEFVRVVEESRPKWAVMENVLPARRAAPDWPYVIVRDWDVGGLTFRKRCFWFYGIPPPKAPMKRTGLPAYSVLATSWNHEKPLQKGFAGALSLAEASRRQGYPELGEFIMRSLPGGKQTDGKWKGVSLKSRHVFAIHVLGNGVPYAMGDFIASHVCTVLSKHVEVPENA